MEVQKSDNKIEYIQLDVVTDYCYKKIDTYNINIIRHYTC